MKTNSIKLKTFFGLAFLVSVIVWTSGCKTMPSEALTSFAPGVTSAKTQSEETFQAINELIAEDQLEDAAHATNLSEHLFYEVLDAQSLKVWDDTLAKLETYSLHLQALTSPDLTKNFVAESENLGANLQAFGQSLQAHGLVETAPVISPGVAAAFTEVGNLLIRAKAQRDAIKIAQAADASICRAFQSMADSLGDTAEHGLRTTVRDHWQGRLAEPKKQFRLAEEAMQKAIADNPADKQKFMADAVAAKKIIAASFLELIQKQKAEDELLAALRRSLLNLANLHSALAKGSAVDARALSQIITGEVKASRDIYAKFASTLKK